MEIGLLIFTLKFFSVKYHYITLMQIDFFGLIGETIREDLRR